MNDMNDGSCAEFEKCLCWIYDEVCKDLSINIFQNVRWDEMIWWSEIK
jgi:hypothetical protein